MTLAINTTLRDFLWVMMGMKGSIGSKLAISSALALGMLTSCAGSPWGDSVQQSLEADPQLEESSPFNPNPDLQTDEDLESTTSERADSTEDSSAAAAGNQIFIDTARSQTQPLPPTDDEVTASQAENTELQGIPDDLQSYIRDLQALDVVNLTNSTATANTESPQEASPFNQIITRREYARWLFNGYNVIYADQPGERLRLGNPNDEPAFKDVSSANPDFAVIQGLAEAGIIPSAFTGNSTAINFRPDAPLTREDLILWKVPLDTQSALPSTTPEAVKEAWGFQDAASIAPLALQAIAADYQLGDFSNFRRAFGYTTLFRPDKPVTRAEAAAVLWRFGTQTEGRTAAAAQSSDSQTDN